MVSAKLLDQEKLDVAVAFWKTPFSRHPEPDRRVVPERVAALHSIASAPAPWWWTGEAS